MSFSVLKSQEYEQKNPQSFQHRLISVTGQTHTHTVQYTVVYTVHSSTQYTVQYRERLDVTQAHTKILYNRKWGLACRRGDGRTSLLRDTGGAQKWGNHTHSDMFPHTGWQTLTRSFQIVTVSVFSPNSVETHSAPHMTFTTKHMAVCGSACVQSWVERLISRHSYQSCLEQCDLWC